MRHSGYIVCYNGDRIPLRTLCEQLNLNYSTMYNRVVLKKWDIHQAVNTKTTTFRVQPYKYVKKLNPFVKELTPEQIDEGIESWHFNHRKYFTKEFRLTQYKALNRFYKMFKNETLMKAA